MSARDLGGLLFITLAGWAASLAPRLPFVIYGLLVFLPPLTWKVIVHRPRLSLQLKMKSMEEFWRLYPWMVHFSAVLVLQALANMLLFIMPAQLPFFLALQWQDSSMMTGTAPGALTLSGGCLALLYSRILLVVGYARIFVTGYGCTGAGFLFLRCIPPNRLT